MLADFGERKVIPSRDVRTFFRNTIDTAMSQQGVATAPGTVDYVAGLLTEFSRAERLYEHTDEGVRMPVLAFIYGKAVEARSADERAACMQRLGDVSLFLSGMFADSFNRKLVDVDYCISMGEGAYAWLSDAPLVVGCGGDERAVFAELADNFSRIVDVLNEIAERAGGRSDRDVLRLYERWLKTGSPRAANQLRALGVEVSNEATSRSFH